MRVRQRSLRHATETLAVVGLALFLVGGDVKGDEEDQVRSEDANSRESCKLFACALASVGHPLEVSGSEVGVGSKVYEAFTVKVSDWAGSDIKSASSETLTKVDDELDDLKASDPLLPPAADTACALEVVPVHDHVNGQVQGDHNPRHRRATEKLSVAENSRSAVVVAVKESCETIWSANLLGRH